MTTAVELSVVIPCLNEADTLEACIARALKGMRDAGCRGGSGLERTRSRGHE